MVMQVLFRVGHALIATTKQITLHKLEEHEERSHAADIIEEENYVEPMFHCAHCDYKTNDHLQLTAHMEISHTLADNTNEQEIADAIEVWKIYKLLQRMKNK